MRKNNRITQSIIVGLTTLVAALSWAGLKSVLFESGNWLWPSIGFFVLLIFLSLTWLMAKSKAILLVALVLILASFFTAFSFSFQLEYLAALSVALLFFLFGSHRAIDEKEVRIKIQAWKILQRGMPCVMTGLCLVAATVYYFSPLSAIGQEKIEIPRPIFETVYQVIIDPISQAFGEGEMGLVDKEEIRETLFQTINGEINKRSEPYKGFFPIGLSVGIFFALKVISIPFMWLVILFSWLIFRILVALGAIKIQEQAVLKEVIEV